MTGKVVRRLLTGRDEASALRDETNYATTLVTVSRHPMCNCSDEMK